ncbi:uncharacterized protein LOC107820982 [Nicotiana tabacum]|uniref:Uncharacterized protein LOC107820982 n=1 Tax=Nicotiana tabacum TaxID=4097 RepID=A0AC58S3P4_TOBAC
METIKSIIKDIDDDHFSILVDESSDVSCKEKMTIILRYVDRRGSMMERFMVIVHVRDTSALSLRNEIVSLLAQHSLSPSSIHGQCYDGASNMQGDLNVLKILMQKESREMIRESQAEEIEEALRKGELETGKGLNQELGLARAGDTQ